MSVNGRKELGINAAQTVPSRRIDESNMAQALQQLYDLLGAAKLGRASGDSVFICGIELRNMDKKFEELENRVKELESKIGVKADG